MEEASRHGPVFPRRYQFFRNVAGAGEPHGGFLPMIDRAPSNILVAENNPSDAETALAALTECDQAAKVVIVADGEEALDYLHGRGRHRERVPGNPAVVLLNLQMPKIDGLGVLRAIKQDESLRTIPVIMLAVAQEAEAVGASYRCGVNALIVKPRGSEAFIRMLRMLARFWINVNVPPPPGISRAG